MADVRGRRRAGIGHRQRLDADVLGTGPGRPRAVASGRTHALEAAGRSIASALIGGYRLAFLIAAGYPPGVGAVVATVVLRPTGGGPEERDTVREVEILNPGEPLAT